MSTQLYRIPSPLELELQHLRAQVRRLRHTLAQHEHALAELRAHLFSFEGRYIRQVGILYKRLDEWEQKRAALHAPVTAVDAESDSAPGPVLPAADTQSSSLRALFRELAKRIHPDHARDADDERRRTRLMAQANDALQRNDRRTLQRMLNGFEAPAHNAQALEAEIAATRELLQQLTEDIAQSQAEHHALAHSDLARLEAEVMQAARTGRDLLAETAARIQGRIGLAMRAYELDLDRIKRPPRGLAVDALLSAEAPARPAPRYDPKLRRWIR